MVGLASGLARRSVFALLLVVAALGGCSSGGTPAPGYTDPTGQSGTRLRRRYFEGGPGAYMTTDFWDTQLETACSFEEAVDGALRCLPTHSNGAYYSDASCTAPVYAENTAAGDCGEGWAYEDVTQIFYQKTTMPAVITGSTLYHLSNSGCTAGFTSAGYDYWVAEQVLSSTFVRGTRSDETRTGGMIARFVDGEDGSRALLETVHGTRGYTCAFDADGYCVPDIQTNTRYLDPGCSNAVAELYGASLPAMLPMEEQDARGCTTGKTYYERGATLTPATVYYLNASGVCTSQPPTYHYYALGAPIALDSLPKGTLVDEGDGDLRARRFVDDDGAALERAHAFWDTSHDEECDPAQTDAAGDFVCLEANRGYTEGTAFADAACSASMELGTIYCESVAPRLITAYGSGYCADPAGLFLAPAVYERGVEVGPDYYFQNDYVTCEMQTLYDTETAYRLGPDATATLPPLTLAVE